MVRTLKCMLLTGLFSLFMGSLVAQEIVINYDEAKIPAYELPDPLIFNNGKKVANADEWTEKRRAEILEIFAQEMYGHVPVRPDGQHFKVLREETVYEGLGIRKVVRIFLDETEKHWFDVRSLPHIWESREILMPEVYSNEDYTEELKKCIIKVLSFLCQKIDATTKRQVGVTPAYIQLGVDFTPTASTTEMLAQIKTFLEA